MLWVTAIVGGAYLLVVRVAERGQASEHRDARSREPLGPALVPLAVGWFLGHDLTLLLGEGQNAYALDLGSLRARAGTSSAPTTTRSTTRSSPSPGWPWVQLVLIAVGHVASVVLLHELAMQRLSPRAAMRTTWAMAAVTSASIAAACVLVLT